MASILEALIEEGVPVADYAIHRPTLEEAFLQLVGTDASRNIRDEAER